MLKVPWAEPIESFLRPAEGVVTAGLFIVVLVTILLLWKGSTTGKTAWLVWLAIP